MTLKEEMRDGKKLLTVTLEGKERLGRSRCKWKIRTAGLRMRSPEMKM
jgi:hypothetical protein